MDNQLVLDIVSGVYKDYISGNHLTEASTPAEWDEYHEFLDTEKLRVEQLLIDLETEPAPDLPNGENLPCIIGCIINYMLCKGGCSGMGCAIQCELEYNICKGNCSVQG